MTLAIKLSVFLPFELNSHLLSGHISVLESLGLLHVPQGQLCLAR